MVKKISFKLTYIIYCLVIILLTFEFIYRTQIVDTYLPELRAYNSNKDINSFSKNKCVLALGDSFTAGESYVDTLRRLRPDYKIINSGIVGTGIIQALFVASRRVDRFKPLIIIYQVYVGNDLFNIRYPVNWEKSSFLRNIYWTLERYFRSLGFLAYRLSQYECVQKFCLRNKIENNAINKTISVFDAENYNEFEKTYLVMDPSYLEETIFVSDKYKKEYNEELERLNKLVSICASNKSKLYILVIPHPCQISSNYFKDMQALGARFKGDFKELKENEYPFIKEIRKRFENKSNVYILNPMQFMKNLENAGHQLFFVNDPHFNVFGQKMLGEYVAREIFEEPVISHLEDR